MALDLIPYIGRFHGIIANLFQWNRESRKISRKQQYEIRSYKLIQNFENSGGANRLGKISCEQSLPEGDSLYCEGSRTLRGAKMRGARRVVGIIATLLLTLVEVDCFKLYC